MKRKLGPLTAYTAGRIAARATPQPDLTAYTPGKMAKRARDERFRAGRDDESILAFRGRKLEAEMDAAYEASLKGRLGNA